MASSHDSSSSHNLDSQERTISVDDEAVSFFRNYFLNYLHTPDFSTEQWKDFIGSKIDKIGKIGAAVRDYRCIREGRYAVSRMDSNPAYQKYIKHSNRLRDLKFVDIGCCFGTDLRQLLLDGASLYNITALDQYSDFWRCGLDLFDDNKNLSPLARSNIFLEASFLSDDFFKRLHSFLGHDPRGTYDCAYMGSVLHLLNEQDIERAIEVARNLLKVGGIYFGQNVGISNPGYDVPSNSGKFEKPEEVRLRYLHSPSSLEALLMRKGFCDVEIEWRTQSEPIMKSYQDTSNRGFLSFYAIKS